jgi:hypothetical protein
MLRKAATAVLIFGILFAFFGNNQRLASYTYTKAIFSLHQHPVNATFGNNAPRHVSISYSKHVFKQDHIKVRYMGGECAFNSSFLPETYSTFEYAEQPLGFRDANFIPSNCRHLSQLRGPPTVFIA